MNAALLFFALFVAVTLVVTAVAARHTGTTAEFYSAGRKISGLQNGMAIAGDYMSAASFLGITGLIAFYGYDGFMYSVGWFVAYLTVLYIVAEPLRNIGKFTMADVLAFRLRHPGVRVVAAISTLAVCLFYMIAQMVGAGSLVSLLIPQISFVWAIAAVGALMVAYVVFGGMFATTWVQIVKSALLMGSTIALALLVLAHYHFSIPAFFDEIASVRGEVKNAAGIVVASKDFTQPGLLYNGRWGALNLISLGVALIFGTAGLPHILVRFYTVPDAKAARSSVVWAMILIGSFYLLTTFLGFGAATLVGKANIGVHTSGEAARTYIAEHPERAGVLQKQLATHGWIVKTPNNNLAAPLLAQELGGNLFLSFIAATALATILAVVAGLTIAASSTFAYDVWLMAVKRGVESESEQILVARIAAVLVGVFSIVLAMGLRTLNVAFLVGLAFAVAASANVPAIVLNIFWRRMNTAGTIVGMLTGLLSSLVVIALGPSVMGIDPASVAVKHLIQAKALFPLDNPALVSVPLGFMGAILASLFTRDVAAEQMYPELTVRAHTGIGAEI
jgi:cation/acetate symporter